MCEGIIETVNSFITCYGNDDVSDILRYLIHYMCEAGYSVEDTGLVASSVCPRFVDHELVNREVEKAYDSTSIPLKGKFFLNDTLDDDDYYDLVREVEKDKYDSTFRVYVDEHTFYVIDQKHRAVFLEKISSRKGADNSRPIILRCAPKEVVVYDPIMFDSDRSFEITWFSNESSKEFVTRGELGGATVPEIADDLCNWGWVASYPKVKDAVHACIHGFIENRRAVMKSDIENPGFYFDRDSDDIISVKKVVREPTLDELGRVAKVLRDLGDAYSENLDVLATVIKWGLSSVFSYARKQTGKWLPWLYLEGSAGSGKTTLAKIILYLHGEPSAENNIGGSGFDTVARVGAKLNRDCNPLVVNEPKAAFERYSIIEMMKVCVENTFSRGKMMGGKYRNIPALAPVCFTSNHFLPTDDALLRRLYVLNFSYSERKSDMEKKHFDDMFHVDYPVISPLRDLQFLTDAVVYEFCSNPSLLLDDWREAIDSILRLITCDVELPEWLFNWSESETLDDFDSEVETRIQSFFLNSFNEKRMSQSSPNSSGLDNFDQVRSERFYDSIWNIVDESLLSYVRPKTGRDGARYICFTKVLRDELSKYLDTCNDLKSIAELLGWEYKPVRFGNKVEKVMRVPFDEFLTFLYPNDEYEGE